MPREVAYRSTDYNQASVESDPYQRASFPLWDRLRRAVWNGCWLILYRLSPRAMHKWRAILLRIFGAKMGRGCRFYPKSKVYAPWNLQCEAGVTAADGVEIYNPALICLGEHAILSQGSYVCGATHDFDDSAFPLLAMRMTIGSFAWVCARACVGPGVNVGEGAVLGLGAVAVKDLEAWTVYGGNPAVKLRMRERVGASGPS